MFCEGKDKGLIVDYIGIKKNMNLALKKYTNFECDEFEGVEQAVTIVKDQLEVLTARCSMALTASDFLKVLRRSSLPASIGRSNMCSCRSELETRFMAAVKPDEAGFQSLQLQRKDFGRGKRLYSFYCAVRSILSS